MQAVEVWIRAEQVWTVQQDEALVGLSLQGIRLLAEQA